MEIGQKRLSALYSETGMDPSTKRRNKVLHKARKVGKPKKKKDKKKKASEGSSSGGTSSSSSSSAEEVVGGLFETEHKIKSIARRYPGALTSSALMEAKESLLTTSGMAWSLDRKSLPPLFTHFVRQQLASHMSPPVLQEALTLSTSLDAMLQGKPAYACDVMAQRLKSLESLSQGAHWSVGRQMELVNSTGQGIAEEQESLDAARRARDVNKLRALVAQPSGSRGGDADRGSGKKDKGWKGGGKNKTGGDGKGKAPDGRKDDKGGWQKQKKE